jgi:Holliday junction DNA helicase RuvB
METKLSDEEGLEKKIRPSFLSEFIGHNCIVERLQILISAAKVRNEPLPHILFHGPPGLGKTTLSLILSKEMNTSIIQTSGPAIEKAGDLAGILTTLCEGDILFIDEIHKMLRSTYTKRWRILNSIF